jgi:prevent-host-death family protein
MRSVDLKELKRHLREYIRIAAAGETVLVTDRDRVVAKIVPSKVGQSPLVADARLAEAVREGWIQPPALPGNTPPPRKPVMTFDELMQELPDRTDRTGYQS